jgi:hypothetical protein
MFRILPRVVKEMPVAAGVTRRSFYYYQASTPPQYNWNRDAAYITQTENALRGRLQEKMSPAQLTAIGAALEASGHHAGITAASACFAATVPALAAYTSGSLGVWTATSTLWAVGHVAAHVVYDGIIADGARKREEEVVMKMEGLSSDERSEVLKYLRSTSRVDVHSFSLLGGLVMNTFVALGPSFLVASAFL